MELWKNDGFEHSLQNWICSISPITNINFIGLVSSMKNYKTKWILQRLTALVMIPLTFWFIYHCINLSSQTYEEINLFFFSKVNASLFFILMISMLYHSKLGCDTIIQDYIESQSLKKIIKLTISVLIYFIMILILLSLLTLTF